MVAPHLLLTAVLLAVAAVPSAVEAHGFIKQFGVKGQTLEKAQKTRRNRRKRDFIDLALVDLAGLYRDALMLSTGTDVGLTHPDFEGLARELADKVSEPGLVECLDAVTTAREHITVNVTPTIAIDGMLGRIRLASQVS